MSVHAASRTAVPGPGAGFRSLDDEVSVDALPLRGELPSWLRGSLLRTGPAKWEIGESRMRHWFDGLAMLHRFSFADGRVAYANRFLESRAYRAARERGRIALSEFATDPCRSLFQRVHAMFSPDDAISDNGNVNVGRLGDRFVAMTETPIPVEFDPRTLAAAGAPYRAPGHLTTAHPHADRATGAMLNYAARLGPRSDYRFYRVAGDGRPEVLGSLPVREPSYMHSFGLTERFFVLAEFPLVVNPLRLALAGRPYIENYRWRPERGTRITLVDRSSGRVAGRWSAEPCFAFHHVNAFERDGEVVVDVATFEDARIVEDLYLERLRGGDQAMQRPRLRRFRLTGDGGDAAVETVAEAAIELPRINYRRCNERPYRYVWGVGVGPSGWMDHVVKVDVEGGATATWAEPGTYPGEPVFVAAPEAEAEDHGVLLSVVLDAARERSFLLVLDAADLRELGRAEAPHHIPLGFHGQFTR